MPAPGCGLPGRATSAHHAWSSVATHPTRPMIARRPLVYPSTLLQSPSRHVRPPDVHAHLGWPRACSPSKTAKVISSKATVLRPDPADTHGHVTPRTRKPGARRRRPVHREVGFLFAIVAKQDLTPVPACMHGRVWGSPGPDLPNTKSPASRQAQPGGGDFWSAEERSSRVGARSALRHHFGRGCPNAENEVNAVSSAARPSGEHHRAVGAFSARPLQYEPPPGCACRDARQRQRQRQRRPGNE